MKDTLLELKGILLVEMRGRTGLSHSVSERQREEARRTLEAQTLGTLGHILIGPAPFPEGPSRLGVLLGAERRMTTEVLPDDVVEFVEKWPVHIPLTSEFLHN